MVEGHTRVHVEQADWRTLLPFVRLFRGFRMAIHPARLGLALALVVLTYLGGLGMDVAWGPQVYPDEIDRFLHLPSEEYAQWRDGMAEQRDGAEAVADDPRIGVFRALLEAQGRAFEQLIHSATRLNFGLTGFLAGEGFRAGGVLGALSIMILGVPGWLLTTYPGFLAVFLLFAFLLTALLGGAIARLAAVQVSREASPSAFAGLRFTGVRYPWFVLAPLIPLIVAGLIGLALAVAGLALFNAPVLDVIGAVLFGLLLLGGFVIAVILIGLLIASPLLLPALAVEGTDAFDAISRAFNYVIARPWHYLFYNVVMVVYGAITYLFVGLVVYVTLWATKAAVGWWAFAGVGGEDDRLNRFDAILPAPQLGELVFTPAWDALDASGTVAAAVVLVWVRLLIALLPAYAVSFFFCQQTWIYLLLRHSTDEAELDEVYLEPSEQPEATPEKLEPGETQAE